MKKPKSVMAARLLAASAFLWVPAMQAQKPTAPATTTGNNTGNSTNPGSATSGSRTFGNTTTNSRLGSTDGYEMQRPIFLSGSVIFDDGAPLTTEIRIERVCNGTQHVEAHTDSKGRFSFQVGAQNAVGIADADIAGDSFSPANARGTNSGLGQSTTSMGGFGGMNGRSGLTGCELRAAYPGYVSEVVDLSTRHSMDDPKVGVIVLHRLVNVKGSTLSVISAQAPKSAQKNYEKALQLIQKGKLDDAVEHFQSATAEYPKYALAWFNLGRLQQRMNKLDDAKTSYLAAAAADSHYVSPYDALALLAAQQAKWDDTVKFSKNATDLNPVEFPSSFWYNALANYNLKNVAEAEKSARALVKIDNRHYYPEAETMLAEFAASRGELDDASGYLRTYLSIAPTAKNTDAVKRELERLDQARATQAKATPAAGAPH